MNTNHWSQSLARQGLSGYPEIRPVTRWSVHTRAAARKHASPLQNFLYLAVIAAMIFGILQCARVVVSDLYAISILHQSQGKVEQYFAETARIQKHLQHELEIYSSPSGIEELARNSLQMVGKNEIMVRFQ